MSYLRAIKVNERSVEAFYLRAHHQNISPFTLNLDKETVTTWVDTIRKEL